MTDTSNPAPASPAPTPAGLIAGAEQVVTAKAEGALSRFGRTLEDNAGKVAAASLVLLVVLAVLIYWRL